MAVKAVCSRVASTGAETLGGGRERRGAWRRKWSRASLAVILPRRRAARLSRAGAGGAEWGELVFGQRLAAPRGRRACLGAAFEGPMEAHHAAQEIEDADVAAAQGFQEGLDA